MNTKQYLLLDLVALGGLSTKKLIEDDFSLGGFVIADSISRLQLCEELVSLYDAGFVAVDEYDTSTADWDIINESLPVTYERLESGYFKRDASRLMYSLTASGGAEWETFSEPRWDDLFLETPTEDDSLIRLEATSYGRLLDAVKWFGRCRGIVVDVNGVSVVNDSPWNATYWKCLPNGIVATFPVVDRLIVASWPSSTRDFCRNSQKWCRRGFNRIRCDEVVEVMM